MNDGVSEMFKNTTKNYIRAKSFHHPILPCAMRNTLFTAFCPDFYYII